MASISSAPWAPAPAPPSTKNNMVNPFDKSFFKFLIGFAVILVVSFVILYVASTYA